VVIPFLLVKLRKPSWQVPSSPSEATAAGSEEVSS
jgi:hypothetical protein